MRVIKQVKKVVSPGYATNWVLEIVRLKLMGCCPPFEGGGFASNNMESLVSVSTRRRCHSYARSPCKPAKKLLLRRKLCVGGGS